MPRYRCLLASQAEVTVDADSVPAALLQARAGGDAVVRLREERPVVRAPRVTELELATFYRQLASMVQAGLPLADGLQVLARDTGNPALREVCYTLYVTLARGDTLAEGLASFPTLFPRLHLALARAGERAGLLPVTLAQIADHLEHTGRLSRRLSSALVYPAVIGTIVVALLASYWGTGMVVKVVDLYHDLGIAENLPSATRLVLRLSHAALPALGATLLTAGVVTLIVRAYYRTHGGRYQLDRAKLWLPFLGQIASKGATARFCRTLGLLLRNGVEVERALSLAGEASGNALVGRAADYAAGAVVDGVPLARALATPGVLPSPVTDQLAAGEESGTLFPMLASLADFYEAQAEHLTRAFSAVIEPLLILVLGFVVGLSVISLMLPLVQVIGSLQGGGGLTERAMQETLESAALWSTRRRRVHLAPEGIAIGTRRLFSAWEEPRLIGYAEVQSVGLAREGRRWAVELQLAEERVRIGGLPRGDAEWISGLIEEELSARVRRSDPAFRTRVPLADFGETIEWLCSGGEREAASLVDFLLLQAVQHQASDVHFDPFQQTLRVRFRIDGVLTDVAELPRRLHPRALARLKVLSKLSVFQHDVPQEGRTVVASDDRNVDLRVSVLPTIHGEKAVIRLFDSSRAIFPLAELGLSAATLSQYQELIGQPQGTLLLTGPANSGKTTTLYSTLSHLYASRRNLSNIVTVEDPVEYDLQVISQTQVNPALGLTFAAGLRTVLRQDPEVIMVGEIRDPETAGIAVRAGLTGHLILSTAHARSAAGLFARLIDVGVEPFLVASSVTGVMEQRLVRRVCPECAQSYRPEAAVLARAGFTAEEKLEFRRGVGCEACGGSGYRGRTGVFSLIVVDEAVRELVMQKAPTHALEEATRGRAAGLLEEGRVKVAAGLTTVEELLRVVHTEV